MTESTENKKEILSRYGRTEAELEAFYNECRARLGEKYILMDYPSPSYRPALVCDYCKGITQHAPRPPKVHHIKFMDIEGEEHEVFGLRQTWACSECGKPRAWGMA